ncbi:hypothetical protein JCM14469_32250 [Desulfatiferula olefinivorans]
MTRRSLILMMLFALLVAGPRAVIAEDGALAVGEQTAPVTPTPSEDPAPASVAPADPSMVDPAAEPEQNPMDLFDQGYALFSKDDFIDAAPYFYRYISENGPEADEYDWAAFFLGISLKKSGYSHAAVDVLTHLVTRKPNTRIVTYILELFETMSRTMPYDRDKVIHKAIIDQDYGFVDSSLTDFINYHQGLFDWENGFDDWGDKHFAKIRQGSYYHFMFRYRKALYDISRDRIDEAVTVLEEINGADFDGEDLKNQVRKTLARLLYEKKEYERADELYQSISHNIVFQAQNLMERSWAQYRMGHAEKAMGLLYAFKAPVYRNYFTPEYFLLKSFIYKDVCHYQRALAVIDEFRDHYREALDAVYGRKDPTDNQALLLALLGHRKINETWAFLRLLDTEHSRIQRLEDPGLSDYLRTIYDLRLEQARREFRLRVDEKYVNLANDLLEYEEKADLMAYEVGLDMYQRVYQYHYTEGADRGKTETVAPGRYLAVYPFQGEFWNDELNMYKVTLEDKCACMEEWDIFFK